MECTVIFFLKLFVGIFNSIFTAIGAAFLGLGAWMRITSKDFSSLLGSHALANVANILMITGGVIVVIGIIGFFAICKENKCLLTTYFLLMIAIFNLEVATGILAYIYKIKVTEKLEENLRYAVQTAYGDPSDAGKVFTRAVDYAQIHLKCCGASNYTDWQKSEWYRKYGEGEDLDVPKTCCKDRNKEECNKDVKHNKDAIHQQGCMPQTLTFFRKKVLGLGFKAGIGAGVFQIAGIVMSILLCHLLRKRGSSAQYSSFVV